MIYLKEFNKFNESVTNVEEDIETIKEIFYGLTDEYPLDIKLDVYIEEEQGLQYIIIGIIYNDEKYKDIVKKYYLNNKQYIDFYFNVLDNIEYNNGADSRGIEYRHEIFLTKKT